MLKDWQKVLLVGLLAAGLTGCSGDGGGEPTEDATADSATCDYGHAIDELEVEFGQISAASDEWSQSLERQWRHYIPVTVTNVSDKPCVFQVFVDGVNADDDGLELRDDLSVALKPGQSYQMQAFNLIAEKDSEDEPAAPEVAPQLSQEHEMTTRPYHDYYDADLEVEGIVGEGTEAKLVAKVTVNEQNAGMPARVDGAKDRIDIHGLDADGNVITKGSAEIDPPAAGETITIETQAGASGHWKDRSGPLSTYDDVVSWEIGRFQPVSTEYTRAIS